MNIFINGSIYCMDQNETKTSAIAWEGNEIVDIGSSEHILIKYPNAEARDLNGRSVFPGFIDPHHHLFIGTLYGSSISFDPNNRISKSDIVEILTEAASDAKEHEWVVAYGYNPSKLSKGKSVSRQDLDDIAPNHPVAVINFSFHECLVNSTALEIAGIDDMTESPFGGEIERDKNGKATGRLLESAWGMVEKYACESLIKHNEVKLEKDLAKAQNDRFSAGITRIGDPQVTSTIEDFYHHIEKSGTLKMPVVMFPISDINVFCPAWDKLNHIPTGRGSDILRIGPLKLLFDGGDRAAIRLTTWQATASFFSVLFNAFKNRSFETLRAMRQNPAQMGDDKQLHVGLKCYHPGEDIKIIREAVEKGFSVAIHAIGNEAVDDAIKAITQSRQIHRNDPPPRIEHGIFLEESLIKQMNEQNIMLVTQPSFLGYMGGGNLPNIPGISVIPLRSLLDTGVRVAGSSDWPAAPYDPLEGIHYAVSRETPSNDKIQAKEAITVQEAFALYTREAAYALGCFNETGSLEKGKRADMVVLSEDPYTIRTDKLAEVSVLETILGGESVFKKSTK